MNLVSVIVPVYNVEKYIKRCICSIINQSYKNLEIILVDDGSKDNSGSICDDYAKQDNRVKVIHKDNGGLSDARNAGIEIAKGKYLCFVDSDDYIDKEFVQTLYDDMAHFGTNISAVNLAYFDDNNKYENASNVDGNQEILNSTDAIRYLFTNDKYCNYAWNKMYKAELFQGVRYPFGKKMEDLGTTYRLFNKAGAVVYNPKPLYYYYQRSDSILHSPNPNFWNDKYDLTYQRFLDVKNIYPELMENYHFYVNTVFECYQYLNKSARSNAKREMKVLWPKVKNEYKLKRRIKYCIFQLNDYMFVRMFRK